ncbi:MAG: hypothetical protein GF332_01305 [Candidatus Moranbacteria bacterium]|nr:hypothetical protein [Candidatus Moranbacteria bacterium]
MKTKKNRNRNIDKLVKSSLAWFKQDFSLIKKTKLKNYHALFLGSITLGVITSIIWSFYFNWYSQGQAGDINITGWMNQATISKQAFKQELATIRKQKNLELNEIIYLWNLENPNDKKNFRDVAEFVNFDVSNFLQSNEGKTPEQIQQALAQVEAEHGLKPMDLLYINNQTQAVKASRADIAHIFTLDIDTWAADPRDMKLKLKETQTKTGFKLTDLHILYNQRRAEKGEQQLTLAELFEMTENQTITQWFEQLSAKAQEKKQAFKQMLADYGFTIEHLVEAYNQENPTQPKNAQQIKQSFKAKCQTFNADFTDTNDFHNRADGLNKNWHNGCVNTQVIANSADYQGDKIC